MSIKCSGCGQEWSGLRRCHCSKCHQTFNSPTAFDMHLEKEWCGVADKLMPRNKDGYLITEFREMVE